MKNIFNKITSKTETVKAEFSYDGNTVEYTIKKSIPVLKKRDVADVACLFVFGENGDEYRPWLEDFAKKIAIINSHSDVVLPKDIEKAYKAVETSGVYEFVRDVIGVEIVEDELRYVDKTIKYRYEALLKRSKLDDIISGIGGVIKALGQKINDSDINDIINEINVLMQNASDSQEDTGV